MLVRFLRSRNYVYESGKFDPEVYIRGPTKAIPTQDVRADAVGHWPQIDSVRQRCKFPKCTGHTSFKKSKNRLKGARQSKPSSEPPEGRDKSRMQAPSHRTEDINRTWKGQNHNKKKKKPDQGDRLNSQKIPEAWMYLVPFRSFSLPYIL
ncbi:hypothetical protein QQF64_029819 [Cirrhinus molitorella]|uniref:Uncharacterized protein n=1 Tax=Cirrhinus molitorella TaxID=172907 RepID=A0ABR3N1T5_9TELE